MARSSPSSGAPTGVADPAASAGVAHPAARELTVPDAEAMRALGAALAAVAQPGDMVCLFGDLGAGKTQFAKGFGAGLGVADTVTSPSFVLMAEYGGRLPLFHIDLYRLAGARGGAERRPARRAPGRRRHPRRMGRPARRRPCPAPRLDVRIDGTGDDAPDDPLLAPTDARHARYLEAVAVTRAGPA